MGTGMQRREPGRELLNVGDVATLLGISRRHVWSLRATGRLPAPIRLGRSTRWVEGELRRWLAAGAPPRAEWGAKKRMGREKR